MTELQRAKLQGTWISDTAIYSSHCEVVYSYFSIHFNLCGENANQIANKAEFNSSSGLYIRTKWNIKRETVGHSLILSIRI